MCKLFAWRREEFHPAMNGVREFNRLQGIDLKRYQCETICRSAAQRPDSETEKCRLIHVFCTFPAIRKRCAKPEACRRTRCLARRYSRSVPAYASYGMRVLSPQGKCTVGWLIYRHPARTITCGVPFAVTQLKANQNNRITDSTAGKKLDNIRIFCTHDGAICWQKRQE